MPERAKPGRPDSPLGGILAARIRAAGPLTVAEYMEAALSDPVHGYYMTRDSIGAVGDFITAPEISQMFGEMLGAWCMDTRARLGLPERFNLIELGPGRGTLMADMLRVMKGAAPLAHFVETSPALREKQASAVPGAAWRDRLEDVPQGPCIIVANEFFDALPIHQFEKTAQGWMERCVGWDDGFCFVTRPPGFDVAALMPPGFMDAPVGSVFEVSPAALGVMEEIARRVAAGGAALVVDYGHAAPGLGDTLQAVSRHGYSGVLEAPGTKDITAHVDFGTLKTLASQNARVLGPVGQGAFLKALGIGLRAQRLAEKAGRADIALALHRLTSPSEMGELFKVMAVVPKGADAAGFGP